MQGSENFSFLYERLKLLNGVYWIFLFIGEDLVFNLFLCISYEISKEIILNFMII